MSNYSPKPGSGAIFRNTDKAQETDRDYRGDANIEGFGEVWISGWIKEGKRGKFLSLSIKPKQDRPAAPGGARPSLRDGLDDQIPFAAEWRG